MSFIKLDRAIVDSYCFANPNHLKVWLWLLVKANFKKNYVPLQIGKGTTTILVDRGQLIFGRFVAEKELKMDGSMVYRILKKFKELKQIEIEANNQYSVITICKYDSYQNNNSESEQQLNNQCTTNEQQMNSSCIADEQSLNTLKEGLECKESKEGIEYLSKKNNHFVFSDFNGLPDNYNKSVIEQFKIQKQTTISSEQVKSMWDVFKLQNLTGTKFYNNEHSVYQHFVNWIKNQNFNNGTNKSNSKSISSISSVATANFEALRNWSDQFSDDSPNGNAK